MVFTSEFVQGVRLNPEHNMIGTAPREFSVHVARNFRLPHASIAVFSYHETTKSKTWRCHVTVNGAAWFGPSLSFTTLLLRMLTSWRFYGRCAKGSFGGN